MFFFEHERRRCEAEGEMRSERAILLMVKRKFFILFRAAHRQQHISRCCLVLFIIFDAICFPFYKPVAEDFKGEVEASVTFCFAKTCCVGDKT